MDENLKNLKERLDRIEKIIAELREEIRRRDLAMIRILSKLLSNDLQRKIHLLERERTEIIILIEKEKLGVVDSLQTPAIYKDYTSSKSPILLRQPSEKQIDLLLRDGLTSRIGRTPTTSDRGTGIFIFFLCLIIVGLFLRYLGTSIGVTWTTEMNVVYVLMTFIFSAIIALFLNALLNYQ